MSKNKITHGTCALTGTHGKFVKCHIIPQAFTRPTKKGEALYQSTRGKGETRRWTSWYDPQLVTREGEDILSDIDNAAIKILRKHQLVWSGWMAFRPHFLSFLPSMPSHGLRLLEIEGADCLIRFALSLAWRASASQLPDLSGVKLPGSSEEEMKKPSWTGKFSRPQNSPFR